jgi:large subunit ribosomal protein L35
VAGRIIVAGRLMPKRKLKTHKGTARRFEYTGTGKLMRTRHGKSHLRRNRSKRAKREYDEMMPVAPQDYPRIKRLMPYGK